MCNDKLDRICLGIGLLNIPYFYEWEDYLLIANVVALQANAKMAHYI